MNPLKMVCESNGLESLVRVLTQAYHTSSYKKVFEFLATRTECDETLLSLDMTAATGLSELEIRNVFKFFENQKLGRYVKGSRGHDSRFVFDGPASPIAVGKLARGEGSADLHVKKNPSGIAAYKPSKEVKVLAPLPNNAVKHKTFSDDTHEYETYFKGSPVRFTLPKSFKATDVDELAEMLRILVKHRNP